MEMCLPKFDIYESTVVPNCCSKKKYLHYQCLDFFSKKRSLSDVRSDIYTDQSNIVSTGQSVRAVKHYIFRTNMENWRWIFYDITPTRIALHASKAEGNVKVITAGTGTLVSCNYSLRCNLVLLQNLEN